MNDDTKHIFKLDPAKIIKDQDLDKIINSKTDLIMVSGTDGVTSENITTVLEKIRDRGITIALEISHPDAVVPGFEH